MTKPALFFWVAGFVPVLAWAQSQTGGLPSAGAGELVRLNTSLQELAARTSPAVVQIHAVAYAPVQAGVLPSARQLARQESTGSGVLLDPQGYIVTNAHVVDRARRIQVQLAGPVSEEVPGRSILQPQGPRREAQLLGIDHETDLALLKIEGEDLPYLPFGDSDQLSPGELVLALGSPLGLVNSVTLGIVSATARQLLPEASMIYIQTDAPINPGNSGGALINVQGELVGINTLIFSQSGGNEGIGFAAPSNIVRHVYGHIRNYGRVRRGEVGVTAQTLTPNLAAGLGLSRTWGVILADVPPGGPAQLGGLQVGDVVLALDGKPMENARQFEVNVYQRLEGEMVRIEVLRAGERLSRSVRVRERTEEQEQFLRLARPEENLVPELGILGIDVDSRVAQMLPPPRKLGGVVVAARTLPGRAAEGGFLPGDVIHQLNGKEIQALDALRKALRSLTPGSPAVLQVQRGTGLLYLVVELE